MQLACSSWSFHREIPQEMNLLSFPAWCGSQGLTQIEVVDTQFPSLDHDYLTEFSRACRGAGVQIACLAISNDFTIPDADQHFAQVERTRHLLYDVAKPLGIPVVRVFMGMADTSKEGDQRALETFRGMVTDLEATRITMALENHARISTSAEQTMAIITGVESDFFGSCLDFGTLPEDRRYDNLEILAPFAKHVHAKSYEFDEFGFETSIDYRRALAILTQFGYDGIISVEYEGRDDAYQGVLKTRDLIDKFWYQPSSDIGRLAA